MRWNTVRMEILAVALAALAAIALAIVGLRESSALSDAVATLQDYVTAQTTYLSDLSRLTYEGRDAVREGRDAVAEALGRLELLAVQLRDLQGRLDVGIPPGAATEPDAPGGGRVEPQT